jgi:hypothetical protein
MCSKKIRTFTIKSVRFFGFNIYNDIRILLCLSILSEKII